MRIERNVSAEKITTYKGGGVIKTLYLPETQEELFDVARDCFILGGGSNIIIADGVVDVPVASTALLNKVWIEDGKLHAEAGAKISKAISFGREYGLGGFEFLSGVPATVGGVVKMNAGAFLRETKDYISKIKVLNGDCAEWLDSSAVDWEYRKGAKGVIYEVEFALENTAREESIRRARGYLCERKNRQPSLPSAGSVFKNADLPAGKYIDLCGLKGKRIGGAEVSEKHANFIVNTGGGSASDYIALANLARKSVEDKFGVKLIREFEVLE